MANITFISVHDRNAYGLRLMSANLKKRGHECHIIFLKRYDSNPTLKLDLEEGEYPWMGINKRGRTYKYAANSRITPHELELLGDTVEKIKPDVIGLSVTTPLRTQASKVTEYLRERFDTPVVWGGFDPTVNAEACLELCDYSCIGESDQTILDIADHADRGESFDNVPNVAFMRDGKVVKNDKYPVEQDLDSYPWRDDSPENKYFIEDNVLIENYSVINDKPSGVYQAMSARGCPYKCSYCCEATFKSLYDGEKFLRRRTPEDLIAELVQAKKQFDLNKIQFEDEIFAMGLKWLREFVPLYKKEINLPFSCYIYPVRRIEEVLTLLKSAGLDYCCLALESGSVRINKEVFDRVYDRDLFLQTARVCKELEIKFYSDVITFNPYEVEQDLRDTLDVLIEIGGGFTLCVNRLFVLPGTMLAVQMEKDGKAIGDPDKEDMFNYYARLIWITSFTAHARIIIAIIDKMKIFRRYPRLLNPIVVEAIVNPISGAKEFARFHLPTPMVESIQTFFAERRASRVSRQLRQEPSPTSR